jgi:hypothetical protein
MILNNKIYKLPNTSLGNNSFLKIQNWVKSIEECDIILISCYDIFYVSKHKRILECIERKDKKIIIDSSAELTSTGLYDLLDKTDVNLSHITVYSNGYDSSHDPQRLLKMKTRGLNIQIIPFFLKYMDYYKPFYTDEKEKKRFLFMVGKPKPPRVALLGLISYYDLLEYGYVSFFTDNEKHRFYTENPEDYWNTDAPDSQKHLVKLGFEKLPKKLILDTPIFSHKIAHDRKYCGDYFKAVDFVIVVESDIKDGILFITEKISKVIQHNKPFVLLGSKGLLKYTKKQTLKHLGIDISPLTDWCDTSYDDVDDVWQRVEMITKIVQQVC